mmetsp:Transcript_56852/g.112956  ORF Transcript_56852/g.112956 Transcript_56852/m.112956 type:complete len:297 (-) Transcript_56852:913-1803(-)
MVRAQGMFFGLYSETTGMPPCCCSLSDYRCERRARTLQQRAFRLCLRPPLVNRTRGGMEATTLHDLHSALWLVVEVVHQIGNDCSGGSGDARSRSEDLAHAGLVQECVISLWDDAACDHHCCRALTAQLADELWDQRSVPGSLRAHTNHMHVSIKRLQSHLRWSSKKWTHVHIVAEGGKRRSDHVGSAVVAVLAHLGNEYARASAMCILEGCCGGDCLLNLIRAVAVLVVVSGSTRAERRRIPPPRSLERVRDLTDGAPSSSRLDGQLHQVPLTADSGGLKSAQCSGGSLCRALGT